jgi:hypothetical protein
VRSDSDFDLGGMASIGAQPSRILQNCDLL